MLPFAGAELALLGWALHGSMQRRFHAQNITLTESDVSIETLLRGQCAHVVFPRHWAQVKLRRPAARLHPSRLTIESHGRQCELGSFLTEEERRGLALRLQRLVGHVNESPSWPQAGEKGSGRWFAYFLKLRGPRDVRREPRCKAR